MKTLKVLKQINKYVVMLDLLIVLFSVSCLLLSQNFYLEYIGNKSILAIAILTYVIICIYETIKYIDFNVKKGTNKTINNLYIGLIVPFTFLSFSLMFMGYKSSVVYIIESFLILILFFKVIMLTFKNM